MKLSIRISQFGSSV